MVTLATKTKVRNYEKQVIIIFPEASGPCSLHVNVWVVEEAWDEMKNAPTADVAAGAFWNVEAQRYSTLTLPSSMIRSYL
jgi:hypothetical protein